MDLKQKLLLLLSGGAQSYAAKAAGYGDLLFHWPLDEASGTTATNLGSVASANGTYSASDIAGAATGPDGGNAPLFVPADNDKVDIHSTAFASNWPTNGELSVGFFMSPRNASVWTDGTGRYLFRVFTNSNNSMQCWKVTNSTIRIRYEANNIIKEVNQGSLSSTGWLHFMATVSLSNDRLRFYYNGSQVGSDVTGLGAWSGQPISAAIGALPSGVTPWDGSEREFLIYGKELPAAAVADLATI